MGCTSCIKSVIKEGTNQKPSCSSSCQKKSSIDWLIDYEASNYIADIVEVKFKDDKKDFFLNKNRIDLDFGKYIVVEQKDGYDIGFLSLKSKLAKRNAQLLKINLNKIEYSILGYANESQIDIWEKAKQRENHIFSRAKIIAREENINMKICEVEMRADNLKVIIYYTAYERVDFRELIRKFAFEFKLKIEMKQIGIRQEAAKIGGIGSCGRELCCSTWINNFENVTINAPRYQQISVNSQKLLGQCGKLKCCLNYELENYIDTLKQFPKESHILLTKNGKAKHIKTDVFALKMYYFYEKNDGLKKIIELDIQEVKKIIEANKANTLYNDFDAQDKNTMIDSEKINFSNPELLEDNVNRFDKKPHRKASKNNNFKSNYQGKKTINTKTNNNTQNQKSKPNIDNNNSLDKTKENRDSNNRVPNTNNQKENNNQGKYKDKRPNNNTQNQRDKQNIDNNNSLDKTKENRDPNNRVSNNNNQGENNNTTENIKDFSKKKNFRKFNKKRENPDKN